MDDVLRDFFRAPQGTKPAAVITNKKKKVVPLRAVKIFPRFRLLKPLQ